MIPPSRICQNTSQLTWSRLLFSRFALLIVSMVMVGAASAATSGTVVAWGAGLADGLPLSVDPNQFQKGQSIIPDGAQSDIIAISAGDLHSVALRADGSVIAWGAGDYPRFSQPEKAWELGQSFVPILAQSGVQAIAAGSYHTLALKTDGSVIAWGAGTAQAGEFDFGQSIVPANALSGIIAVAAGYSHSLALKSSGEVVGWGRSRYRVNVVPTNALSGVVAIAAGDEHSLALKVDGSVIAWGAGTNSTGGYPNYGQSVVPTAAKSGVVAIAAGGTHSMALKADGSVWIWGDNRSGQRNTPTTALNGVATSSPAGAIA